MLELHVCNRNGAVLKAFAIGDADELLVGRDDSCDIQIRNALVSREHCAIEREGESLILRDLNSTGGTFMNGERISKIAVGNGTTVDVGPAVLKFYEGGF